MSFRYTRTVARDNTVRLGSRWLQLPPGPGGRSYAGRRLELRECVDGRLLALEAGRILAEQLSPGPDFVAAAPLRLGGDGQPPATSRAFSASVCRMVRGESASAMASATSARFSFS